MLHPLHLPLLGDSNTSHSPTDSIKRINKLCSILTKVGNLEPAQTTRLFQAIEAVSYTTDNTKSFANAGIKTIGEHLQAQGTATSENAYSKLRTLFTYNLIHDGNCFEKAGELYEIDLNGLFSEEQLFVSKFLIEFLLDEIASMKFRSTGGLTLYLDEAQEYDYKKGSTLFQLLSEARKADTIMILSGTSFGKNASITDQCHFRLCFQETERNNINEILQNYDLRTQAVLRVSLRNLPRGKFIAHGDFCEVDAVKSNIVSHDETLFTYFPRYINRDDNNH